MSGLKISLLGGMEIGPDGGASEVAVTRKAGAMIAYLALQNGHAQSREKLAGLLWSRNTDDQARTNLRQALSRLRKALSNGEEGPLVAEGDRVALDMDAVVLDAAQFEALIDDGTPDALEEAVALYRGDLLDGINLSEAGFESWLRGERERFRVMAVDALLKLIGHYEVAGDADRSIRAALRLLAVDPLQEAGHRALMRAYAAQGRLALALEQYETCRDELRRTLGVEPDAETCALVAEIQERRSHGERMDREIETLSADLSRLPVTPPADVPSIAVLPFENRNGDPEFDYIAESIAGDIVTELTRFRDLFVIAPASSFHLNGQTDPVAAAARLKVSHVLRGGVRQSGRRLRVTVQLISGTDGRHVWAENYDRPLDDLLDVQDEITELIVANLIGQVEDSVLRRAKKKKPGEMSAYEMVMRGKHELGECSKESTCRARALLAKAIEIDPELATAWTAVAVTYVIEYESVWSTDRGDAITRAEAYARKAVELDDLNGRAHWVLACAHLYQLRHDAALQHIQKAIALNPLDYSNHCVRSWILSFVGKPMDALAIAQRALQLNPLHSDGSRINAAVAEYTLRNYAGALERLKEVTHYPNLADPFRVAAFAQLGRQDEAKERGAQLRDLVGAAAVAWSGDKASQWRTFWHSVFPYRNAEDLENLLEGLRKAGLPA